MPSGCPFDYSASNFEVLALIAFMLQKIDSVGFFVQGEILNRNLQGEDNGTASFLLCAGEKLLYTLEDPIRVHTCWWNILETPLRGWKRAGEAGAV